MSAGDFEVDIEHEGERARDDDLVLRKLGHADVQGFPGLALVGLKVILFTVLSAFMAPRTFSECEGSRLGGTTSMVYNVFSKLICILVMAEYDPRDETTDKDPLILKKGDDDDDDPWNDVDWEAPLPSKPKPDRTQPFEPGGASTPYPEGEMTNLPQEQSGRGETIPEAPEYNDLVDTEALVNGVKELIKAKFPKADFSKIVISLGKQKVNESKAVALGPQGGETVIFGNGNGIDNMEDEGGTTMERKMETDRLKRESEKLKRDIKEAKKQEKEYAQTAKEQDKVAKEVERLKRQYENQRQKRDTAEATLNRTKPLDELEREREELKRKIEEDRRIMNDKDATSRERMVAGERFSENTDELARLDPQIQEREQELPLRERVKNIFKKYGWTLQAVALAVGIVLSALALAATNGLKAGTQAIGNGLKTIGQKLGSLLPGLIGSIVSYIFKAAGSVLSFLGEHAWLLILAVVAFFMERMLKRRRR